ncbi:MAG: Protein cbp3, mitochondrial [Pleopsidium flavum]|nr:MAG: Protein cbp3, mitochondrial [Pleopsidium flavum]
MSAYAKTASGNPQQLDPQLFKAYRTFSSTSRGSASQRIARKTHSPAPILPPKSDPPSKNINFKPETSPKTSTAINIAQEVRKRASRATETYIAYGAAEQLMKECARQGDYSIPQSQEKGVEIPKTKDGEDLGVGTGWWYTELGLAPTFNTWAQVTFLHMYLLNARLRNFPADHAPAWHQHLLDHFFYEAENRMTVIHNVHARAIRNRYLKDLFVQWRGLTAGYDEGLVKGDAVLAAAVWRNVFKGDEEVDLRRLGEVVSYMRRVLKTLDTVQDEAIASGRIKFGDPGSERDLVSAASKMMSVPITDADVKPAEGPKKA